MQKLFVHVHNLRKHHPITAHASNNERYATWCARREYGTMLIRKLMGGAHLISYTKKDLFIPSIELCAHTADSIKTIPRFGYGWARMRAVCAGL